MLGFCGGYKILIFIWNAGKIGVSKMEAKLHAMSLSQSIKGASPYMSN